MTTAADEAEKDPEKPLSGLEQLRLKLATEHERVRREREERQRAEKAAAERERVKREGLELLRRTNHVPPAPLHDYAAIHRVEYTPEQEQELFAHLCSGTNAVPMYPNGSMERPGQRAMWDALDWFDATMMANQDHIPGDIIMTTLERLDLVPDEILIVVADQIVDEQDWIRDGKIPKLTQLPSFGYVASKCVRAMDIDKELAQFMEYRKPAKTIRRARL